jgi:hypothetical protein
MAKSANMKRWAHQREKKWPTRKFDVRYEHTIFWAKKSKKKHFFCFSGQKVTYIANLFCGIKPRLFQAGRASLAKYEHFSSRNGSGRAFAGGGKIAKNDQNSTFGMKSAVTFSRMCFVKIRFKMDILGLGGHPSSIMSTFYNVVKKFARLGSPNF